MDLWQGPLREFVRAAESGAIAGDMTGNFVRHHQKLPTSGEVRSWEHSLAALAAALRDVSSRDVGVAVATRPGAHASATGPRGGSSLAAERRDVVGVVTEYHLPLSGYRADVMLCGSDESRRARAIVLELKQWSSVGLEDDEAVNVEVDGVERPHPCQQALDYAEWLTDYHSAFANGGVEASPSAYCHNMKPTDAGPLRDPRFKDLMAASPLFIAGDEMRLAAHVSDLVGRGNGLEVLGRVTGGRFSPSKGVLQTLEAVLLENESWHLLDTQRVAHGAVLAEVRRLARRGGRSVVLVRGGPGTGKSVIAVQLLADALRLQLRAAHSTGGKAFTTTLRSKFKGADRLFLWNMALKDGHTQPLDLLLVDEAHRIRKNSDYRFTPMVKRNGRPQVEELITASKVSVFFLDENQFMRPDEIGTSALIREAAHTLEARFREYDLSAQFRCSGCEEYIAWVDHVLDFRREPAGSWRDRYRFRIVARPEELQAMVAQATTAGEKARIVAGFSWKWSNPAADGALHPDVQIGSWAMPWNRKPDPKKSYRPSNHPYTLWAETDEGLGQVGCIYSAQGFEFDRVGVIWGPDLVWRSGSWVAVSGGSHDVPVRRAEGAMLRLVRNAYRVLLTRGTRETTLLCLDEETRRHLEAVLDGAG